MAGHPSRLNGEAGPESRLRKGHPDPPLQSLPPERDAPELLVRVKLDGLPDVRLLADTAEDEAHFLLLLRPARIAEAIEAALEGLQAA